MIRRFAAPPLAIRFTCLVWVAASLPAIAQLPAASGMPQPSPLAPKAATPGTASIPGILDAGPILRAGDRVYVGNCQNETTDLVSVIDASVYGAEHVIQTIPTPVNPVDLAVIGSTLCLVDENRDKVWHKPLAGGSWSSVALPPAIVEFDYGSVIFAHPTLADRVFVIHSYEERILLVNVASGQIESTLTNLKQLPRSIGFSGDGTRMAVMCGGYFLGGTTPPNVKVYDLASLSLLHEIVIPGSVLRSMVVNGNDVYVQRSTDIRRYDIVSGQFLSASQDDYSGRHLAHDGQSLFAIDSGFLIPLAGDLSQPVGGYWLLQNSQVWFPPLEEIAAFEDGRAFVANRNDDTVSVVYHHDDCFNYGAGCAGSGGFVPKLIGENCPFVGTTYKLTLIKGLGGATALLFAGTSEASVPLAGGCTFLVAPVLPPLVSFPLGSSGPGAGSQVLLAAIPAGFPTGLTVTVQAIVLDSGVPRGFSATNGVHATLH